MTHKEKTVSRQHFRTIGRLVRQNKKKGTTRTDLAHECTLGATRLRDPSAGLREGHTLVGVRVVGGPVGVQVADAVGASLDVEDTGVVVPSEDTLSIHKHKTLKTQSKRTTCRASYSRLVRGG